MVVKVNEKRVAAVVAMVRRAMADIEEAGEAQAELNVDERSHVVRQLEWWQVEAWALVQEHTNE